jgi:hypothetical protein
MLYLGQTHTVNVPIDIPRCGPDREAIRNAFETAYREAYGRLLEASHAGDELPDCRDRPPSEARHGGVRPCRWQAGRRLPDRDAEGVRRW